MGSQPDFPRPMFPNYRGSTVYVYHLLKSLQFKSNQIQSLKFNSIQFKSNQIKSLHFNSIQFKSFNSNQFQSFNSIQSIQINLNHSIQIKTFSSIHPNNSIHSNHFEVIEV